jgi:hypothetical protein
MLEFDFDFDFDFGPALAASRRGGILAVVILAGLFTASSAVAQDPDSAPAAEPLPPADEGAVPAPCAASAFSVRGVADEGTDFARVLELSGRVAPTRSWTIVRPSAVRLDPHCGAGGLWDRRLDGARPHRFSVELLPVSALVHHNSAYPRLDHDGALWTGRGLSSAVSLGAHLEWGPLSATLAPTVAYQANADFETRPHGLTGWSPWIYLGQPTTIDWPQRFGDEPFTVLDPGQSQLSLRARGFAMGYGTENVWWGPAQRYPLMMGAGAPGVPSFFVGTYRPVDVWLGGLEMELTWGTPVESDYFDRDPDNDRRLLSGIVMVFRPHRAPGLSLGASRTYMVTFPPGGMEWSDFFFLPYRDVRENPQADDPWHDDQMLSVWARWAFPEAGFEAYLEWGREDHWADWGDLTRQPDHSRAMMGGFQKVFAGRDDRWVRVRGEGVVLGGANTFRAARYAQTWYVHTQVRQGHTHRGQLLGSVVGPGSDAQFLGADLFHRRGRIGAFVERVRYDDDAYYNQWAPFYGHHGHDIELSWGLSQLHFLGPLDLSWAATVSSRHRRNFVGLDGVTWDFLHERNAALRAAVTWRPGLRARLPGSP